MSSMTYKNCMVSCSMHASQHLEDELTSQALSISKNVLVHGDNTGIVEGWWKHRHHNKAINGVFWRIHDFLHHLPNCIDIVTTYVSSEFNPADDPSRGILRPTVVISFGLTCKHLNSQCMSNPIHLQCLPTISTSPTLWTHSEIIALVLPMSSPVLLNPTGAYLVVTCYCLSWQHYYMYYHRLQYLMACYILSDPKF